MKRAATRALAIVGAASLLTTAALFIAGCRAARRIADERGWVFTF